MLKTGFYKLTLTLTLTLTFAMQIWPLIQSGDEFGGNTQTDVLTNNSMVRKQLQGTWAVTEVSVSANGDLESYLIEEEYGGELVFHFDANNLFYIYKGMTRPQGEFSVDTSHSPTWIDVRGMEGVLDISEDSLKIRWEFRDWEDGRVTDFDFSDGRATELHVLKRIDLEPARKEEG